MKRIELTIPDDSAQQLMAALATIPIHSLAITTIDFGNEELEQVISYIQRTGEQLQSAGRRNSLSTASDLVDGLRKGNHRQLLIEHVFTAGGGGGPGNAGGAGADGPFMTGHGGGGGQGDV